MKIKKPELVIKLVGKRFFITSPDVKGLYVAHEDREKAIFEAFNIAQDLIKLNTKKAPNFNSKS